MTAVAECSFEERHPPGVCSPHRCPRQAAVLLSSAFSVRPVERERAVAGMWRAACRGGAFFASCDFGYSAAGRIRGVSRTRMTGRSADVNACRVMGE